ncbi:MAG: PepSY-associated TM helix domain-containing protein [Bacteroidota bacterium]
MGLLQTKRGRKTIRIIHLWLGLASGLVIFVVSITGCIYVFEKELKSLFYKDHLYLVDYYGHGNKAMKPATKLIKIAKSQVDKNFEPNGISVNGSGKSQYVQFYKPVETTENRLFQWYGDQYDYYYRVYLHPYTGKVLKVENTQWEFFMVVEAIHTSLLLGPLGEAIVTVSILIFVLMLITGIILWWPKNLKVLNKSTWFRWKPTTKWRRKNYDFHNVIGFYVLFIALAISLTGLSWSFNWIRDGMVWIGNGGNSNTTEWPKLKSDLETVHHVSGIDRVHTDLITSYPNLVNGFIVLPKDSDTTIYAFLREREDVYQYWLHYDQYSGKLLYRRDFDKLTTGEQFYFKGYSIHVGSILGPPGKVLAFLASLLSASLPITGFLIWWGRRKNSKKSYPRSFLMND